MGVVECLGGWAGGVINTIYQSFIEHPFAQSLGLLSFALGILCFYQKDDRRLKIIMVVMNINHAIHFALLGASTAVVSAVLSAFRTGLALKTSSQKVAYAFIAVSLTWGLAISDVWYDMFPILGTSIGTYAVFCLKGIKMRIGFLLGALCWVTNNIIVGSIGTTMLELTLISVNLLTIWRLHRDSRTLV